jgi:hypothetical protein
LRALKVIVGPAAAARISAALPTISVEAGNGCASCTFVVKARAEALTVPIHTTIWTRSPRAAPPLASEFAMSNVQHDPEEQALFDLADHISLG